MLYSEPLFRPPAEAASLIVQVTEGCAYNRCLFCPMYKGKDFRVHSPAEIAAHLRDLGTLQKPGMDCENVKMITSPGYASS
jgi:hypothetical protein